MKEVACAVCGAVYRFAPSEIPPAGKTLTCAKCKARIQISGAGSAEAGPPPTPPPVPSAPPMAGGRGDVIDLADLPAPKRGAYGSPHAPGSPVSHGPAGYGGDALTLDNVDLLAPVGPSPRGGHAGPPAVGEPIDLPMPSMGVSELPTPKRASGPAELVDLPAPKRGSVELPDLPAPKRASDGGLPDLPAPKRATTHGMAPGPMPAPPIPPRPPHTGPLPDLPAPKRAATPPPRPGAVASPAALFDDLPAPKGPGIGDLTPKRPSDIVDLPAPKGPPTTDLMPKGPSTTSTDLTPKGPPTTDLTPKGPPTQDVAPKGFFADLPQSKGPTPKAGTDVAPKGYFADLPQSMGPTPRAGTDVAPKGFFDDLPQPRSGVGPGSHHAPLAPSPPPPPLIGRAPSMDLAPPLIGRAPSLDLDGIELSPPVSGLLELEPASASARQHNAPRPASPSAPPPRNAKPGTNPPPLELGGDSDSLAGLDLPAPNAALSATDAKAAAARGGVVSFKPSATGPQMAQMHAPSAPAEIDLAMPSRRDAPAKTATRPARDAGRPADAPRVSRKTLRVVVAAVLVAVLAGGGGFYAYTRWQTKQQHAADVRTALDKARTALAAGGKNRWDLTARAARAVLTLDKKNPEALGIAAQALIAGYLDEGTRREPRLEEAQRHLAAVPAGAGRAPAVDKAIALDLLVEGDTDAAAARLQPLVARHDGDAMLYLGWAYLAAGRWDDAVTAFAGAIKAAPQRLGSAKYGLARAQLGKGDRDAARATFLEVIAAEPEHVGALVGETESMPASEFVRREAALLAILQRKGIDAADPRVVARAWTLAGDDARRAGRLDTARDRYRKALTLWPGSVDAMVSSAALELRDGKLDVAAELAEKALTLAPADVTANLAVAELDIRRNRLADAGQRLAALRTRTPPVTGSELGQLHLLDGMRLEDELQFGDALTAYEEAGKVLGPDELEPAIATATLLGRMAKDARDKKDDTRAKALEAQAKERLDRLSAAAEQDPALAVTLGVAYLAAGSAAESEIWLRKAIAKRPADVEANFQLAEALRRQGKQDEALATLDKAFDLDPTRVDLGVELARGFEAAGKDADASSLYKRLVDVGTVSLDVRVRAGRFFARVRDFDAARKQAEVILDAEPANPAGLYLRAEGMLADGHADDARRLFQQASDVDPDPQFLDGLGRACELLAARTGDTARRDEALRAYMQANEKAPRMLNPTLGRGRLHMARREFAKSLAAYEEALRIAPNEPSVPYGIGISFAELGDRPHAVEWLTRSVKIKPRAEAYFRLGDIYYQMDKASAAAQALSRATELGLAEERDTGQTVPWLTDAFWLLGDVERVRGNDGGQRRAWEHYLERGPTDKVQADEVRRALMGLR